MVKVHGLLSYGHNGPKTELALTEPCRSINVMVISGIHITELCFYKKG